MRKRSSPPRLRMSRTPKEQKHPIVHFLDEVLFPFVVQGLTSRGHIIFLLALIFVVEDPTIPVVVALMAGNWTNIISASASAIVLRQQNTHHEDTTQRHDEHADAFDQIMQRLDAMEQRLLQGGN